MRLRYGPPSGEWKWNEVWPRGGGEVPIETGPGELYVPIVASGLKKQRGRGAPEISGLRK